MRCWFYVSRRRIQLMMSPWPFCCSISSRCWCWRAFIRRVAIEDERRSSGGEPRPVELLVLAVIEIGGDSGGEAADMLVRNSDCDGGGFPADWCMAAECWAAEMFASSDWNEAPGEYSAPTPGGKSDECGALRNDTRRILPLIKRAESGKRAHPQPRRAQLGAQRKWLLYRAAIETDSPMELWQICWRQHGSAREMRIAECSQAGRVELFVAEIEERVRRQRRRHHGCGRHLRSARQIRVVRMARRADFLLLSPLGAPILEPNLQQTEKSRD